MDGDTERRQKRSSALKGFFDKCADANHFGAGNLGEAHEPGDRRTGGEKVVDDQDFFIFAQIFGGDDQFGAATLGVGWGNGDVNFAGHGDRFGFAGVNDGKVEVLACHQSRSNARDFGSEDFSSWGVREESGKFLASFIHQGRVYLVIDEPVDLKNAVAEVFSVGQYALF